MDPSLIVIILRSLSEWQHIGAELVNGCSHNLIVAAIFCRNKWVLWEPDGILGDEGYSDQSPYTKSHISRGTGVVQTNLNSKCQDLSKFSFWGVGVVQTNIPEILERRHPSIFEQNICQT